MMDPITIAMGLARVAPMIAGWIAGDDAEKKAQGVVDVAEKVTGLTGQAAVDKVVGDPKSSDAFNQALMHFKEVYEQEETKRYAEYQATLRADASSTSDLAKAWRPFFGVVVALTWFMQMTGVTIIMLKEPSSASPVITAMSGLGFMWASALAVLGVYVNGRTKEKGVPGMFDGLIGRLMNR